MKIHSKDFRVAPGKKVDLKKWPAQVRPFYKSKDHYKEILAEHKVKLAEQQGLLYASNRHALLLVFQAMDAAGKDGAIKHVMSGVNPQGCGVTSFKSPSSEDLDHDFLWRGLRFLPERGKIGIFNRSYYEEVLVVRVHPEMLAREKMPARLVTNKIWQERFEDINAFERYLSRNGVLVLKMFLNLSKRNSGSAFSKDWIPRRKIGNSRKVT